VAAKAERRDVRGRATATLSDVIADDTPPHAFRVRAE
jgi:hypothetical protein